VSAWEGFAHRVGDGAWSRLSLINMLSVARLAAQSALLREESRGTHSRRDCPMRDDENWRKRIVHVRGQEPSEVAVDPAAGVAGDSE
ncbi:MAG: hypothetical protein P1V36_09460, partial [Planctomycetota bacterium]|nr:hypothetical protein [Planctomycetota bacterium]